MTDTPRPRFAPAVAWTIVTEAPLRGVGLARESGTVLAWDEGDRLYLIDPSGTTRASSRAPAKLSHAAISDTGTLVAAVGEGPRLWLLGPDLEPIAERSAIREPSALAIDPHGRFVAIASKVGGATQLYNRHGKQAGRFETLEPLAHLAFVASAPMIIAAGSYGMLVGVGLRAAGQGKLAGSPIWQQSLMANIGRVAATGDGGMILTSCYTHGIQRFDLRGRSEGSYHLGGTAAHAVPDFAGRTIVAATTEGELAVMNGAGNVRWKTAAPRAAIGLEVDALGRSFVYGLATGEVVRVDLEEGSGARPSAAGPSRAKGAAAGSAGRVRPPDWSQVVAQSDEEAETAVLAVLDDPPRIGLVDRRNRLQAFTVAGQALGQAPEIAGVGRFLRTCPGWIAAATDRQILLYDARRNGASRVDLSLVEVTHLAIRPDGYGLAIVQERDRVGRAHPSGRWVWRRELNAPVEDLALGPDDLTAVTTEEGRLRIFGPDGEPVGGRPADPPEPLGLIAAPPGSPEGVAWITLARRLQVLRGHRADGTVLWESPVPWEGWQLVVVGFSVVVASPDGRSVAFDGAGRPRSQGRDAEPQALYAPGPGGRPWRLARQGVHLICSELSGRVAWRAVADEPIGPLAFGRAGAAALFGRSLAWFASPAEEGVAPEAGLHDL
ncbi:MAG TPA: hypothetical protein VG406_17815 [Isosphaeraceae bacterium]|jgi:hypothetical protein|nr:hypothetical protein [Isosphaeraceae bacterium]